MGFYGVALAGLKLRDLCASISTMLGLEATKILECVCVLCVCVLCMCVVGGWVCTVGV